MSNLASPQPLPDPESRRHILVTGAAGGIGSVINQTLLQRGHHVRGFDRHDMPQLDDAVVGRITDVQAVEAAMIGIDTLIHLAAMPNDADFLANLIEPNVKGLYVVMAAARRHRLRRIVLASSVQTVEGLWKEHPDRLITVRDARPMNHYGLTKLWAEQLGEMYSRCYGLSVIAARLGWVVRSAPTVESMKHYRYGPLVYLSHADAQQFFLKAVEADHHGFDVLYAVGPGVDGRSLFDLQPARQIIGYQPAYAFADGLRLEPRPEPGPKDS